MNGIQTYHLRKWHANIIKGNDIQTYHLKKWYVKIISFKEMVCKHYI